MCVKKPKAMRGEGGEPPGSEPARRAAAGAPWQRTALELNAAKPGSIKLSTPIAIGLANDLIA